MLDTQTLRDEIRTCDLPADEVVAEIGREIGEAALAPLREACSSATTQPFQEILGTMKRPFEQLRDQLRDQKPRSAPRVIARRPAGRTAPRTRRVRTRALARAPSGDDGPSSPELVAGAAA